MTVPPAQAAIRQETYKRHSRFEFLPRQWSNQPACDSRVRLKISIVFEPGDKRVITSRVSPLVRSSGA